MPEIKKHAMLYRAMGQVSDMLTYNQGKHTYFSPRMAFLCLADGRRQAAAYPFHLVARPNVLFGFAGPFRCIYRRPQSVLRFQLSFRSSGVGWHDGGVERGQAFW